MKFFNSPERPKARESYRDRKERERKEKARSEVIQGVGIVSAAAAGAAAIGSGLAYTQATEAETLRQVNAEKAAADRLHMFEETGIEAYNDEDMSIERAFSVDTAPKVTIKRHHQRHTEAAPAIKTNAEQPATEEGTPEEG